MRYRSAVPLFRTMLEAKYNKVGAGWPRGLKMEDAGRAGHCVPGRRRQEAVRRVLRRHPHHHLRKEGVLPLPPRTRCHGSHRPQRVGSERVIDVHEGSPGAAHCSLSPQTRTLTCQAQLASVSSSSTTWFAAEGR
jgi:hypothetical protein